MYERNLCRNFRGGGWDNSPRYSRVPDHSNGTQDDRYDRLGVRLVEVVEEDQTPASGSIRVRRGSSWLALPQVARVAARYYGAPDSRYYIRGVRLVEEVTDV